MLSLGSRLRDEVTKLQTAARCTALVQFGLKEQVSSLQSRLKLQSEELDAAYTEIEQQQDQNTEQDCDDPELAAELAAELAELMNELEATQRERDEAQAELASSRAGIPHPHPHPHPARARSQLPWQSDSISYPCFLWRTVAAHTSNHTISAHRLTGLPSVSR